MQVPKTLSQMGAAFVAGLPTALIILLLVYALPLHQIPTFEELMPAVTDAPEKAIATESSLPASTAVEPSQATSTSLPNVRYWINFGDSLSRTGFMHNITGPGSEFNPSAKNPIGNPEFPGKTTTSGVNWLGYMSTRFNSTLTLVWNYAGGGSVVDREVVPPRLERFGSFVEQIGYFNETLANRPDYAPWTPENTVASIWFGMNELGRLRRYDFDNITRLTPPVIESMGRSAQVLHDTGIRNFVFFEMYPMEVVPTVIVHHSYNVSKVNFQTSQWNRNLRDMVQKFQKTNSEAKVSLIQLEDIIWEAANRPHMYKADNATCQSFQGQRCLWWDAFHPAQALHLKIGHRAAEIAWSESIDFPGFEF